MRAAEYAIDVEPEHLRVGFDVAGGELPGDVYAGVGEHDVDATKTLHRSLHHAGDVGRLGHVGARDQRLRVKLGSDRFQLLARAGGQRQFAALVRQAARGRFANAGAGAGDDDNFASQRVRH